MKRKIYYDRATDEIYLLVKRYDDNWYCVIDCDDWGCYVNEYHWDKHVVLIGFL